MAYKVLENALNITYVDYRMDTKLVIFNKCPNYLLFVSLVGDVVVSCKIKKRCQLLLQMTRHRGKSPLDNS